MSVRLADTGTNGQTVHEIVTKWPPELSEEQQRELVVQASTYSLAHGLLFLPKSAGEVEIVKSVGSNQTLGPSSAIHAPISLFPSPFPREQFELARRLQKAYNVLYARVAMDKSFLDGVFSKITADGFIGRLWRIWKDHRNEGIAQDFHLGIFRSDYMLHAPNDGSGDVQSVALKQVEFNTIASALGPLAERTAAMHRYLYTSTRYFDASPILKPDSFPPNENVAGLAEGLAAAHHTYNSPGSQILFVVQSGERNIFDQRWLEYELSEKHSIRVVRRTLQELENSIQLVSRKLFLRVCSSGREDQTLVEISAVYFRAGYTPNDYTSDGIFDVRAVLERSAAIKCPSIALQLAGSKKVQQVLTRPGVLEGYLSDASRWGKHVFSQADVDEIRSSWMEMWGLEENDGVERAREAASSLVLKPQREGGGNNVYKRAIPAFLDGLSHEERSGWIAMRLIATPEKMGNYLLRADNGDGGRSVKAEVVSELGIYGWALFGAGEIVDEKTLGWLLRTKTKESDEGGVAVGLSVLDSVVLVDEIHQ